MISGKNRCQDLVGNVKAVKIASIIGQGDGTLDVDGIAWKDLRGNVILLCITLLLGISTILSSSDDLKRFKVNLNDQNLHCTQKMLVKSNFNASRSQKRMFS